MERLTTNKDVSEMGMYELAHNSCYYKDGVSDNVCEWKYNNSEYYWESSCDHLHIFMSDGPKENEYRFCPYCGKKILCKE